MRKQELTARLIACFAAVFPELSEIEIPTASIASVSAWDSLATVTLIAVVEEEFNVGVMPENLTMFVSFDLIADFVCSESPT